MLRMRLIEALQQRLGFGVLLLAQQQTGADQADRQGGARMLFGRLLQVGVAPFALPLGLGGFGGRQVVEQRLLAIRSALAHQGLGLLELAFGQRQGTRQRALARLAAAAFGKPVTSRAPDVEQTQQQPFEAPEQAIQHQGQDAGADHRHLDGVVADGNQHIAFVARQQRATDHGRPDDHQ